MTASLSGKAPQVPISKAGFRYRFGATTILDPSDLALISVTKLTMLDIWGQHRNFGADEGVSLQWKAPVDTSAQLEADVSLTNGDCGDGVDVQGLDDGAIGWSYTLANNDNVGQDYVLNLPVKVGSNLDFVIFSKTNNNLSSPEYAYAETTAAVTTAVKDFQLDGALVVVNNPLGYELHGAHLTSASRGGSPVVTLSHSADISLKILDNKSVLLVLRRAASSSVDVAWGLLHNHWRTILQAHSSEFQVSKADASGATFGIPTALTFNNAIELAALQTDQPYLVSLTSPRIGVDDCASGMVGNVGRCETASPDAVSDTGLDTSTDASSDASADSASDSSADCSSEDPKDASSEAKEDASSQDGSISTDGGSFADVLPDVHAAPSGDTEGSSGCSCSQIGSTSSNWAAIFMAESLVLARRRRGAFSDSRSLA